MANAVLHVSRLHTRTRRDRSQTGGTGIVLVQCLCAVEITQRISCVVVIAVLQTHTAFGRNREDEAVERIRSDGCSFSMEYIRTKEWI